MTEAQYGRLLRAAAILENQAIYQNAEKGKGGGPPNRVPMEFTTALNVLFRKKMLTANDLANIIGVSQDRAKFLLDYIVRKDLADWEYNREGGIRIYLYRRANDADGVSAIP